MLDDCDNLRVHFAKPFTMRHLTTCSAYTIHNEMYTKLLRRVTVLSLSYYNYRPYNTGSASSTRTSEFYQRSHNLDLILSPNPSTWPSAESHGYSGTGA